MFEEGDELGRAGTGDLLIKQQPQSVASKQRKRRRKVLEAGDLHQWFRVAKKCACPSRASRLHPVPNTKQSRNTKTSWVDMQKYVGVLEGMKPQFSRPQWPPPSLGQRTRQYCRRRRRFMFCHWSIPGQGWIIIAREPPPTQPSSRTLCVTEESWVIGRRRRRRGGLEGQVHPDRQTLFLSICQERRLFLLGTPLLRQLPSKL